MKKTAADSVSLLRRKIYREFHPGTPPIAVPIGPKIELFALPIEVRTLTPMSKSELLLVM